MKYSTIVAFIFLVFISCQTTDKKTDKHRDELIEQFKTFISGTWVPVDYFDDIVKTRSPLKSSGKITYISEFSIDTTALSGDSIHIGAAMGNHEGGDFVIYFKPGLTPTSLQTNIDEYGDGASFYQLGYDTDNGDTSIVLYHYDKTKKLLGKTIYIRVQAKNLSDDLGSGFQYMLNKKLIAGKYKVSDSFNNETTVEFTADGKIKGVPNLKTYAILTDFVAAPEKLTDEICFELENKKQKCFRFKITEDDISLFEPAKDESDAAFKPGQPTYIFVKQNERHKH